MEQWADRTAWQSRHAVPLHPVSLIFHLEAGTYALVGQAACLCRNGRARLPPSWPNVLTHGPIPPCWSSPLNIICPNLAQAILGSGLFFLQPCQLFVGLSIVCYAYVCLTSPAHSAPHPGAGGLGGFAAVRSPSQRHGKHTYFVTCNGLLWLLRGALLLTCLLYTSPSPRDQRGSRMPSSA